MFDVRVVFVLSPYQNAFFTEIAEALIEALATHGVSSTITREPGAHQVGSNDVFVLLPPHEYVALEGDSFLVDEAVADRTIGLSAEQPTEVHFPVNVEVARRLAATLDFSPTSVAAYRERGVDAVHLPFGYVPSWDRFQDGGTDRTLRTTSVLYLGNNRARRLGVLAGAADVLAQHASQLVVSDISEPNRVRDPWFFVGERKRALLSDTDVLVNIHQQPGKYFEWLRFTEAAHCGAAVLTEQSTHTEPFVDGEHFASFGAEDLDVRLAELMSDPDRRAALANDAYRRLLDAPLAESVRALVAVARNVAERAPPPSSLPPRTRTGPIGRDRSDRSAEVAWKPSGGFVNRIRQSLVPPKWELIAPPGTVLRAGIDELVAAGGSAPLVNVMASGVDRFESQMLEGLWPWQPWRLRHGQHCGRVLLVRPDLHRAALRWLPDQCFDQAPHVRIQLFAAVHGVAGGHIAAPRAALAIPVDPTHALSADLAERCRDLLAEL